MLNKNTTQNTMRYRGSEVTD
ncbi:unnamed protein product, partial [Rotaria socialis]